MNKKITFTLTSTLLSIFFATQSANASFQAQDPRSLGMGGVGVAAANSAQAHFYNPSLLISAKEDEDFNIEIPATYRLADPNNLYDSLKDFSDQQYFSRFFESYTEADNAIKNGSIVTNQELLTALESASRGLQKGFNDISGKSLIGTANVGFLVSKPDKNLGWAAYANLWTDIGARAYLGVNDNKVMTDFINLISNGTTPTQLVDPTTALDTYLSMDAIAFAEFGVSLAMPYTLNNYSFDVGITPKIVSVRTYSFTRVLNEIEENNGEIELNDPLISTSFNIDFGVSKQLNKNWKSGLMIKNIIPQSFKLPSNNGTPASKEAKLSPEMRIGTSYQNNWATIAADLDITKNTGPASRTETQYLAIGTELDVWLVKLRLGYRANLAAANNNTLSAGLGLYLFGLNIDAAIAGGEGKNGTNELNVGAQIGVQW